MRDVPPAVRRPGPAVGPNAAGAGRRNATPNCCAATGPAARSAARPAVPASPRCPAASGVPGPVTAAKPPSWPRREPPGMSNRKGLHRRQEQPAAAPCASRSKPKPRRHPACRPGPRGRNSRVARRPGQSAEPSPARRQSARPDPWRRDTDDRTHGQPGRWPPPRCLVLAKTHDRTEPLTPLRQGFHSLHIGLGIMGSEIRLRGERSGFGQRHAAADAALIRGLRTDHHALPATRIARMQDHRATFKLGLSDDQTLYRPTGQSDADDTLHGDNSRYASHRSLHRFPTQSFHHCEPADNA